MSILKKPNPIELRILAEAEERYIELVQQIGRGQPLSSSALMRVEMANDRMADRLMEIASEGLGYVSVSSSLTTAVNALRAEPLANTRNAQSDLTMERRVSFLSSPHRERYVTGRLVETRTPLEHGRLTLELSVVNPMMFTI